MHGLTQIKSTKKIRENLCNPWLSYFQYLFFLEMNNLLFSKETYAIIGICMEVHRILGHGFNEIVYKDAIMFEANLNDVRIEREKEFKIEYKQTLLQHSFFTDFVFL